MDNILKSILLFMYVFCNRVNQHVNCIHLHCAYVLIAAFPPTHVREVQNIN